MKIDGLVSGLNTAELIDSLVNVAAIPKNLLVAKITDRNSVVTNLQSLNKSLQDFAAKAKAIGQGALAAFATSSSHESVTVSAGAKAGPASMQIVVDQVASAHSMVTASRAEGAWGGTFTMVAHDGTQTEITPAGVTSADLAKAINAAKTGVTAAVVNAGLDAGGNPLTRIQLTSDATGADRTFALHQGSIADVQSATSVDLSTESGAAVVAQGNDAQIRLYAGTPAEQVLTSASNTFVGVSTDVNITVSRVATEPVTVSVSTDLKAQSAAAGTFIKGVADLLTRIDNGSKATVGETTKLGVFTGDSTVRALRGALANAVQYPVDGVSPSSIGISIDRYGVLSFDEEKFSKAMADDPDATQALFTQVSGRIEQVSNQYSDKYDGMLTQRITGQESEIKSMQTQVTRWDLRLEQRRATLERTYASLEVQLSALQSQSSWLTSQLAGLAPQKQ